MSDKMTDNTRAALRRAMREVMQQAGEPVEDAKLEAAVVSLLGEAPPAAEGTKGEDEDDGYDPVAEGKRAAERQAGAKADPDSLAWR